MKRIATRALAGAGLLAAALGIALAAAPKGWSQHCHGPTPGEVGVDHKVVHGGHTSAVLKAAATDSWGFTVLHQWVRAHRYRGKRVRLSAYLKTADVGARRRDGARLEILVFGREQWFTGPTMRGRLIRGNLDWARYEHVIDIPPDAALLQIRVALIGPGQVWADDVHLEVVGKDVPTTGSITDRRNASPEIKQRIQEALQTASRHPVNLDFEQ